MYVYFKGIMYIDKQTYSNNIHKNFYIFTKSIKYYKIDKNVQLY